MKIVTVSLLLAGASAQLADVVTLGTRPYFLVDEMKPSSLTDMLRKYCLWDSADFFVDIE